ncbi:shikimate kinase [Pseudolysinimonas sp.]
MSPRAVFVGPMASGKTKVGKRVARLLGVGFLDTDQVIVARHGVIADLFRDQGEPAFRALERGVVAEALRTDGIVSLGGGAVLDPASQELLRDHTVVFLHAAPHVVAGRLALEAGKRPLVANGISDWERIFAERRPIYEALASHTVDTSTGRFDDISREVAAWLTT